MFDVKLARRSPIQPEFVLMMSRRNMRVSAGDNIRVHADRNIRHSAALPSCGFIEQDVQFGFRLGIEQQNSAARTAALLLVGERKADLLARFTDAGENNALPRYAQMCEVFELSAGHYVEPASQIRERLEDG